VTYFHRSEFLEENSRISDRHGGFSMLLTFSNSDQAHCNFGSLPLTLSPALFLQLGRGKWTLILLISVGLAVVPQGRLKFANRAGCNRISGIFFQKIGSGLLDGGWPCLASRHRPKK
jgi:hypothetical protein